MLKELLRRLFKPQRCWQCKHRKHFHRAEYLCKHPKSYQSKKVGGVYQTVNIKCKKPKWCPLES